MLLSVSASEWVQNNVVNLNNIYGEKKEMIKGRKALQRITLIYLWKDFFFFHSNESVSWAQQSNGRKRKFLLSGMSPSRVPGNKNVSINKVIKRKHVF